VLHSFSFSTRSIIVPRVLVVGAYPFDSGKTHLSIQLGKNFIDSGYSVNYFKPISGHNYWYHYEHTRRCLENRQLVSRDATIVRQELRLTSDLLLMNPVHSLFSPARIDRPLQNIISSLGLSGSTSVQVMQRFSQPIRTEVDSTMLIANKLLEEERLIIGIEEAGMLSYGTSIVNANSLEDFQEFEQMHYEEHVSKSFSSIEKGADMVIIESFNDAVWPWESLEYVDHVFVVSPGHVFNYDPERIRKASFLMKRGNLPLREVTFGRVADLLKPMSKIEVRPDSDLSYDQMKTLDVEPRHKEKMIKRDDERHQKKGTERTEASD
jgi:predicted P-loop ATPase/GTPase